MCRKAGTCNENKMTVQAYLVLLHFTDTAFSLTSGQHFPPAKRLKLAEGSDDG